MFLIFLDQILPDKNYIYRMIQEELPPLTVIKVENH
jgi:hypothetical protein